MINHLGKGLFDVVTEWVPSRAQSRLLRRWLKQACYPGKQSFTEVMETAWALQNLQHGGFSPRHVIDCGAYIGNWTRSARVVFPDAKFLMIEANTANESALRSLANSDPERISHVAALLGPEQRDAVPFYRMDTGSSVMPEQSNIDRSVVNLPMTTLDDVASTHGFAGAELLKLDVQGYELEVLKGATRLLATAEAILLEVSFVEYNQGAPLAHAVLPALHGHGFVVYDIGAFTRWGRQNCLLQADMIFVRRDSKLRPSHFEF